MMSEPATFTLEELSAQVERELAARGLLGSARDPRVSPAPDARTVRYYTTLGLLDRPQIVGRQARYGARHVQQLLAIKALQAEGLPLAEIQGRLYGRSGAELQALVGSAAAQNGSRQQIAAPPPALTMREFSIAPGLRLVVEDSFRSGDRDELLARIAAALDAM